MGLRHLDAWRGALALTVATAHLAQVYDPHATPALGTLAQVSVLGFFAISGLLIAQSLKAHDWRTFALRRIDRLLPPFLCSLLLCGVLWALAPLVFPSGTRAIASTARAGFSMDGLLPTILFLNGFVGPTLDSNGPLWSLSYEVWYYVIAALMAYRQRFAGIAVLLTLAGLQPWFAFKGLVFAAGFLIGWFGRERAGATEASPLAWIARFSYTFYLTHFPILLFCYGAGAPMAIAAVAAFGFAALVGPRLEKVRIMRHHITSKPTTPFTTSGVPVNLNMSGVADAT